MLKVLDLFSGIGGFSLGLERTGGFKTVAFCEIDPYCRKVLAKHWPDVHCYEDIAQLLYPPKCDVIVAGFPCQDISNAGQRAGLAGERSGLWRDLVRGIRMAAPKYAIVENVAALLTRGMGTVLGDLAKIGYDAEWHCIPASAIGAPHRRDRVWIIAYPKGWGFPRLQSGGDRAWGLRGSDWWTSESRLDRVAYGVPYRVDRLRALGNAVVPQIPELIGRAILKAEEEIRNSA